MTLTPRARRLLAEVVRGTPQAPESGLRSRLERALHDEVERAYRLSIPLAEAGLDEARRALRARLEARLRERTGSASPGAAALTEQLRRAETAVAASLLVRLVLLRQREAFGLARPPVATGGWSSKGYLEFRELAPALCADDSEGYGTLLGLVFAEQEAEITGLAGDEELAGMLPVPAAALRELVERLDDPALASAWTDDTTLGWVVQFWVDPERREIDARLDAQGKLPPEDVPAKTQVFTDRYIAEWLLQNALGAAWRAICQRRGWPCHLDGALSSLRRHRADGAPLDALAWRWRYLLDRPVADDAVAGAPDSVGELTLLDPACGSGHFLVLAFDLLVDLYREEARHTGVSLGDREIAESIVERNLHGVDLDPRAVQVAAAALHLKAKTLSPAARPRATHVAAPLAGATALASSDLAACREALGLGPGDVDGQPDELLSSLAGVERHGTLWKGAPALVDRLSGAHAASDGRCPRLLEGLRFLRLCRPGAYHLVVGNPPYFGTQSLADTAYLDRHYPASKENLCTAFLERAVELVRPGGQVAFVTARNWLYVSQLAKFRSRVFRAAPPECAADLGLGAFDALPGVDAMMLIARRGAAADAECVVVDAREGSADDKSAALRLAAPLHRTSAASLARLPGSPFVYRWTPAIVDEYLGRPRLGEVAPVRVGMKTSDNLRFLRRPWELPAAEARAAMQADAGLCWVPYVKGAAGKAWIEPLADAIDWRDGGLGVRVALDELYAQSPQGERHFFQRGVAFSTIGRTFVARAHRYASLFDVAGSSVFPPDVATTVCLLNSRYAREIVESLNPTVNFQVGDVARVPYRPDPRAAPVFGVLEDAFAEHEAADELGPAFVRPGPSAWGSAQSWAARIVDSDPSEGLPAHAPVVEPAALFARLSFAVGVALGRFGARGEGWLDASAGEGLPGGVLFLSARGGDVRGDSLDHPACAPLAAAWAEGASALGEGDDLRTYLRRSFFAAHKRHYENRPIYLPLSSARKSFVALVSIHRWTDDTLNLVLADHLLPEQRALAGEQEDLQRARADARGPSAAASERRLVEVRRLLDELGDFIGKVTEVATVGPPPCDPRAPRREVDAPYRMHLPDGVMVNSAALWPLVEPMWRDPKKWWGALAAARGPKGADYDWSRTAARYFPARVAAACAGSPVVAVAHGCLWRLHPESAWKWELRLQHEHHPEYRIGEPGADEARRAWLAAEPRAAEEVREKERRRWARRGFSAGDGRGVETAGSMEDAGERGQGEAAVNPVDEGADEG